MLPLDDRGEPHASVTSLQLDMAPLNSELPQESWWHREPVQGQLGVRHDGVRLVDGFGRTLGGLGPVRPGYLCCRTQAKLTAIETQTGRRLWERIDLPPNCLTFGDDDRVYLWRTAENTMQVLSAVDGRTIEERAWDVSPDDVLMQHDSRIWVVRRRPNTAIELRDVRENTVLWSRQFEKDAIPFAMDRDTVGVIEPVGLLHLLSADTGAPLGAGGSAGKTRTNRLPEGRTALVTGLVGAGASPFRAAGRTDLGWDAVGVRERLAVWLGSPNPFHYLAAMAGERASVFGCLTRHTGAHAVVEAAEC